MVPVYFDVLRTDLNISSRCFWRNEPRDNERGCPCADATADAPSSSPGSSCSSPARSRGERQRDVLEQRPEGRRLEQAPPRSALLQPELLGDHLQFRAELPRAPLGGKAIAHLEVAVGRVEDPADDELRR